MKVRWELDSQEGTPPNPVGKLRWSVISAKAGIMVCLPEFERPNRKSILHWGSEIYLTVR